MLTVVKLGGHATSDMARLRETAARIAALDGAVVVVHGGGGEISAWQERLGIPVEKVDGLRVTTLQGIEVTAMVLSGRVNKRVVRAFEDVGTPAAGISGEDGALLEAHRARGGALGEVGEVVDVRPGLLHALLSAGYVPVVSPVSRGPGGAPLNVNADEAALSLAVALGAHRIHLVSDVPGVLVDGAVAPELGTGEARHLLDSGRVRDGMAVKVAQALMAAEAGVDVVIGDEGILEDPPAGTRIGADPAALGVA